MNMGCQDAVDEIYLAAVRLRNVCLDAGRCGRAGAACVFYESEELLREIDTARDAIAKSLGITRNTHLEKLGLRRAPVSAKAKKSTTTKRIRR